MQKKENDVSIVFGRVIKELRGEQELSQEKLAELSNLHANYISLLERGNRRPSIETIFKIASGFDIAPHKLIRKVEEEMRK